MSVGNGHYACTCYHPLFVFNQFGDLERRARVPATVHSADGWDDVLKPVVHPIRTSLTHLFSSGRALCNAQSLRVSEGGTDEIRDPAAGQSGSAEHDRLSAHAPSDDLRIMCAGSMPISAIRPGPGPSPGGLPPKSTEIPENFIPRVIVPNVRGQRRAGSNLCACLQPRQFPAHSGTLATPELINDRSADDKLIKIGVKVVSHGRYVIFQMADGRHRTADVLRAFAAHRGPTAATTPTFKVVRSRPTNRRSAE